jgi:hypothetical protein
VALLRVWEKKETRRGFLWVGEGYFKGRVTHCGVSRRKGREEEGLFFLGAKTRKTKQMAERETLTPRTGERERDKRVSSTKASPPKKTESATLKQKQTKRKHQQIT